MDFTPDRPRRRWLRRILIGLGLCLLAGIGLVSWAYWQGGKELRDAIAEAEANDPYWRLADMEAHRAVVPESENSAPMILSGIRIKEAGTRPSNVTYLVDTLDEDAKFPNRRLSKKNADIVAGLDKADAPAAAELRKLKDFPRGRFSIAYPPDLRNMSTAHYLDVRSALETLMCDCDARIDAYDMATATDDVRAMFNAARSVGDEPLANSVSIRMLCGGMAVFTCERLLAMGELSDAQLFQLFEAVQTELNQPLLEMLLQAHRAAMFEIMELIKSNPRDAQQYLGRNADWRDYFGLAPGMFQQQEAAFLRAMNRAVENCRAPEEQQIALMAQWEADRKKLPALVRAFTSFIPGASTRARTQQAKFRCLLVALAAERFRRQRLQWPASIDDLVAAKLLTAVPKDPFDGKPLRWKVVPEGRIIYSVGRDGIDDGGTLFQTSEVKEAGVDQGIRLFNPDQRRLPPRPVKDEAEPMR